MIAIWHAPSAAAQTEEARAECKEATVPIYECLTTASSLNAEQRAKIARAITTIHAEEPGASRDPIHVLFPELPSVSFFTVGKVATPSLIRGEVRECRAAGVRHAILRRIYDLDAELIGINDRSILVMDVPVKWTMEAGRILPEPNEAEEEAWFAELGRSRKAAPEILSEPSTARDGS